MQMHEVGEVTQVTGAGNANKKLAEGWTLLAVTSGSNGAERDQQVVWYVLGKPPEKKPTDWKKTVG